jgi:uncharacterized protein YecT (DUF1311 family)
MTKKLVIAVFLCVTARLLAQPAPDPLCAAAEKVPIPEADLPPTAADLAKCDLLELKSRPGHPVDLRAARYCAYTARAAEPTEQDDMEMEIIGANASLAMIYAGGIGVTPNIPLAERFACEILGGWDNGTKVARMLEARRQEGKTKVDFDICENPTGRQLNFLCLGRNQSRVADEVALAEKHFNTGSAQQRAAFQRLLAARNAYLDAHSSEEPNGTTGTAQYAMADEIDIDDTWARTLNQFADNKLPHYTETDFRKADADLNVSFRKALDTIANCYGDACLRAEQLRQIERAWIVYRDAWVAYAALRWPSTSADSWRTWLTLERAEDLKQL